MVMVMMTTRMKMILTRQMQTNAKEQAKNYNCCANGNDNDDHGMDNVIDTCNANNHDNKYDDIMMVQIMKGMVYVMHLTQMMIMIQF